MTNRLMAILLLLGSGLLNTVFSEKPSTVLDERIPYPIALLKLSVVDNNTGVRISRQGSEDYVIITELSDVMVKNSRSKIDKLTYRESGEKAYYLTDFEAHQILLVNKSFIATLEIFEKHLQTGKMGQCLYLDGFLPKFIRNYFILLGVARNTTSRAIKATKVFEGEYDVSLTSPRSDTRIAAWRNSPECIVKLRIASKELIYQLKLWEKRELANKDRNFEIPLSAKCEEALDLFVRIYFCIQAPSSYSQ